MRRSDKTPFLLVCLTLLICGGCSELSSFDDPRDSDTFQENGSCGGIPFQCNQLTMDSCLAAGGCAWGNGCLDPDSPRCFSRTDEFFCNESSFGCEWDDNRGVCYGPRASICALESNRSDCEEETDLFGCRWTNTCSGTATSCSSFGRFSDCQAQPGCEWR